MKKLGVIIFVVIGLVASFIMLTFRSYPLQDGYRLQGFMWSHGQLYRGYFSKVLDGDVNGIQGSEKGMIFGWVIAKKPNRYFILHTEENKIEWLDASDQAQRLAFCGCPAADMNKEVNLTGLKTGFRTFSRN